MHEMRLRRFCLHQSELILEDVEGRLLLALRLAPPTALCVAHELKSCECGGISTYQLMAAVLKELDGRIVRTVLDVSQEGRPIGVLVLRRCDPAEIYIRCDPADAVALAMRTGVPIYATSEALVRGGYPCDLHPLAIPDLQDWLDTLKPEDFGQSSAKTD